MDCVFAVFAFSPFSFFPVSVLGVFAFSCSAGGTPAAGTQISCAQRNMMLLKVVWKIMENWCFEIKWGFPFEMVQVLQGAVFFPASSDPDPTPRLGKPSPSTMRGQKRWSTNCPPASLPPSKYFPSPLASWRHPLNPLKITRWSFLVKDVQTHGVGGRWWSFTTCF